MRSTECHPDCDVVIVGGGFSGTVLAVQLLRRLTSGRSITIVDRSGRLGRGVAYGTADKFHLLNVRAGNMSALPDQPDHFHRWLLAGVAPNANANEFLPRFLFGEYMEELLRRERASSPDVSFSWLEDEVVAISLDRDLLFLKMRSGDEVRSRFGILATGNCPPATPPQLAGISGHYYSPWAWSKDALLRSPSTGTILLLGTGLTAIDQVLSLKAKNFPGKIVMLSAHGLLPLVHNTEAPEPSGFGLPHTVRALLCVIREIVSATSQNGIPWHTVIDSLRPETQRIWKALPQSERKRFLRHVRAYWEIHRHRVPPENARIVEEMMLTGRLKIIAARILNCVELDGCVNVAARERRSGEVISISASFIINCAGNHPGAQMAAIPIVKSMLDVGLARVEPLGLGLDVAENGALIDVLGTASASLFTIGPTRKGCLWETTAVPEIRCQAADLAYLISRKMGGRVTP